MNYKRLPVYLTPDIYNAVEIFAKNNNESLSNVARDLITKGVRQEAVSENINAVSDIIRRVVRDITRAETDRLAKLIVKTMKASAASMYLSAQVAHKTTELDGNTELDDAMSKAVSYIKTAYSEETEHEPIKAKPIQDEMSKRAQAFKNEDDLLDELLSEM